MTIDASHAPDEVESAIARIAATDRLLVAVDFDGTLSPLQNEPMAARMAPEARVAIDALLRTPDTVVALVSGRSLHDLREIAEHDDDSLLLLAGSHGAEYWTPEDGVIEPADIADEQALRDTLREHAEDATKDIEGIWIEPKTFGFGVHTRTATPEDAARAYELIDALIAAEAPQWRRRSGHNIVEFAFRHEGKDVGVKTLRERVGATGVLFAGDDVTDEDALVTLGENDLGVRVGAGETAAAVRVADIAAFAALLARLATVRAAARE